MKLKNAARKGDRGSVPPGGIPKTAWVVAGPKTGSTWLSSLLAKSLMWDIMQLLPRGYARRDQEIVMPPDFDQNGRNIFLPHHHTKASEPTIEFVRDYKVRVIIMTRRFDDTAVSLIDHLTNDGVGVPVGFIPMSFKTLPFNERAEIVIRTLMPWYVSFYASWAYAEKDSGIKPLYVAYEDLIKAPMPQLARCLTHCDEMRNVDVYNAAIAATPHHTTRFNVGVVGRGAQQLNGEHRSALLSLLTCHHDETIVAALSRVSIGHGDICPPPIPRRSERQPSSRKSKAAKPAT